MHDDAPGAPSSAIPHGETESTCIQLPDERHHRGDRLLALDRLEAGPADGEAAARYDRIISGSVSRARDHAGRPRVPPVRRQLDPARFTCTRDQLCSKAEGVPTAVHYRAR